MAPPAIHLLVCESIKTSFRSKELQSEYNVMQILSSVGVTRPFFKVQASGEPEGDGGLGKNTQTNEWSNVKGDKENKSKSATQVIELVCCRFFILLVKVLLGRTCVTKTSFRSKELQSEYNVMQILSSVGVTRPFFKVQASGEPTYPSTRRIAHMYCNGGNRRPSKSDVRDSQEGEKAPTRKTGSRRSTGCCYC